MNLHEFIKIALSEIVAGVADARISESMGSDSIVPLNKAIRSHLFK